MSPVRKFMFDRSFDEPRPGRVRPAANADADPGASDGGGRGAAKTKADTADGAAGDDYAGMDRRGQVREEETPPPPPPEMFTKEQVEAAREDGYIRGHTEALEEAAKADSHNTAQALRAIVQALDSMDEAERIRAERLEKAAVRLALTIVRRLLPTVGDEALAAEVEDLVARLLPDLMDQPRLIVRVNGAIAEVTRAAVRELKDTSGYEGRVTVRPDNALERGDCRLEWGDGGVERDTETLWTEIEAAVSRHLDEPVPAAPSHSGGSETKAARTLEVAE